MFGHGRNAGSASIKTNASRGASVHLNEALQSDRSVTGKRACSIRAPISTAAACATIPRGRCSGRSHIVAGGSRALQMHPDQRPRHRAIEARASTSLTNGNPKKGGYRDSGPLEITHQRASYAIVFVDRRAIPLKVGFLVSAHWGAPVAAGREARQRIPSRHPPVPRIKEITQSCWHE
jgi:hypothetical protein